MKYGNKEFETVSFQIEKSILDKIKKESQNASITFAEWMHIKLKEMMGSTSKSTPTSTPKTELLAFKEALDQANEAYLKLTKDVAAIKKKLNGGKSSAEVNDLKDEVERIKNAHQEITSSLATRKSWHDDHDESIRGIKADLESKERIYKTHFENIKERFEHLETPPEDGQELKEIRELITKKSEDSNAALIELAKELETVNREILVNRKDLEKFKEEANSNTPSKNIRDLSVRLAKLEDKNTPYVSDLKEQIDDNQSQITKISKSHETDRQGFVNSINSIEQRLATMVTSNSSMFYELEALRKFRWYKPWTWK